MKKFLLALTAAVILAGCSSLAQVEGTSNNAEIERLMLPDSSNIYFINWKGHVYIYSPGRRPNLIEVNSIK